MIEKILFPEQTQIEVPFNYSKEVLQNSKSGKKTLALVDIKSLPAKQPGVHRPCAGPEHDQAYPQSRQQIMNARVAPLCNDNPQLDHSLQSSHNGRPQTSKQKGAHADGDELNGLEPRMGHFPKLWPATQHQGDGYRYAQDEESRPWPTVRKHGK
jgi:hypothetical protein